MKQEEVFVCDMCEQTFLADDLKAARFLTEQGGRFTVDLKGRVHSFIRRQQREAIENESRTQSGGGIQDDSSRDPERTVSDFYGNQEGEETNPPEAEDEKVFRDEIKGDEL